MEDSTFLPDITLSRTMSSSRPHTRGKSGATGKRRHNVIVFPYCRDRLACDPQNTFCVYGKYEFRWGDPLTKAEESICSLIDDMVAAAERAFDDGHEYWKQLPPAVQRAHVLRTVLSLTSSSSSTIFGPTFMQYGTTHTDAATTSAQMRHTQRKSNDASISYMPANTTGGSSVVVGGNRSGRGSVGGRSQTAISRVARREEEEEAIARELTTQWLPPANHTKCRIVLDIVASRKTLGDTPHSSEPYRLGQMAYGYVYRRYVTEVMTMFVGISDSAVTLVGRDILYPYRATGGGGGTAVVSSESPTASGTSRAAVSRGTGSPRTETAALAAALSYVGALNSTLTGHPLPGLSMTPNLEQLLASTTPAPRMVIAPPVNTEKVDNVRLVVCFPVVDIELNDDL